MPNENVNFPSLPSLTLAVGFAAASSNVASAFGAFKALTSLVNPLTASVAVLISPSRAGSILTFASNSAISYRPVSAFGIFDIAEIQ